MHVVPDSTNGGIGFGRFGSAGPPPPGGGSFIFIARRRDPLEGFSQREMPLEDENGFSGPRRNFGNAPSWAPSLQRHHQP